MVIQNPPAIDLATLQETLRSTKGDPPGSWLGSGPAVLGLWGGVVFPAELADVFHGHGPKALQQDSNDTRPAGQPGATVLSFLPPRSVAACWAVAEPELRQIIGAAQSKAVREAVAYLEAEAARVVGSNPLPVGLVAAAFERATHDGKHPGFHTQVALCHLGTSGAEGGSGLDLSLIQRHLGAANALYEAELAHQLRLRAGLHLEPDGASVRLKDFPPAVTEALFKAPMASGLDRDQLQAVWQNLARDQGLAEVRRQPPLERAPHKEVVGMCAEVLAGLTASGNYFTGRAAVEGLARSCRCGELSARMIQGYTRSRITGMAVERGTVGGETVHRTRGQIDRQADLAANVRRGVAEPSHRVERGLLPGLLKGLDRDRQRALIDLTLKSGSCVYLDRLKRAEQREFISRARYAWDLSGFRVVVLGQDMGRLHAEFTGLLRRKTVKATLDRHRPGWRGQKKKGPRPGVLGKLVDAVSKVGSLRTIQHLAVDPVRGFLGDPKTVVLVDRAARLTTLEAATLASLAGNNGAKLVFIGDARQMQPQPQRSPIQSFVEGGGVLSVGEPRPELAPLRTESTLRDLARTGTLVVAEKGLVDRWAEARGNGLLVAANRSERDRLNALAQDRRQRDGALGATGLKVGKETFHEGDRIVVRGRSESLCLKPGLSGTVTKVVNLGNRPGVLLFQTDEGHVRSVPLAEFNRIGLGYAATLRDALRTPADRLFIQPSRLYPERLLKVLHEALEPARPVHAQTQAHQPSRTQAKGHSIGR
jgi:hypothetical protein